MANNILTRLVDKVSSMIGVSEDSIEETDVEYDDSYYLNDDDEAFEPQPYEEESYSHTSDSIYSTNAETEPVISSYQEQREEYQDQKAQRKIRQKQQRESNVNPLQNRSENYQSQDVGGSEYEEKTTIVLKYPRIYDDAKEIVDLLIENECILIDFQFMLDAQARRCLDYIDGASRVLYGKLQKVGSTMYLLTPMNVTVDIDDMTIQNTSHDVNYDYDMKRR